MFETALLNSHSLSSTNCITTTPLSLSILPRPRPRPTTLIRMGGGPRTFPGGVSKWQWKRMQQKKAKQLLKARLSRERQIYDMRKRAELKAAVSELERPWEVVKVEKDKSFGMGGLFSVKADEQLKVLADRFQKPGGYDLWSENDGPQLFVEPVDGLPSARFFPKGVVHSVKPYGRVSDGGSNLRGNEGESSRGGSDVRSLIDSDGDGGGERGVFQGGLRKFRGRGNGKLGNGGSEGFEDEDTHRDSNVRNLIDRDGDGDRGVFRGGLRKSRGRGNGKLGNGGSEGLDEESLGFSGLGLGYGNDERGGQDVRSLSHDGQRGVSRGGLRNSRGRGNGRLRNVGFGGGSEGSHGEEFGFSGSRRLYGDNEGGGQDVSSLNGAGQRGGSRGGLRNSRGRRNERNSSRRMGGGSFGSETEGSTSRVSIGDDRRRSKNRTGHDSWKDGNGMAFRSRDEMGEQVIDLEGRKAASKMRSDRRGSTRGRTAGRPRRSRTEDVFDMSLLHDGSYGFGASDDEGKSSSEP